MSRRMIGSGTGAYMSLAGLDFSNMSLDELIALFKKILDAGIHGISFSPYIGQQGPGDLIEIDQIRARMNVIKNHTRWVRIFSCTDGIENCARVAREDGLKTMVGAWLGDDPEKNEKEIQGLIQLAKEGLVDIAAVGNEVLLRGDLNEDQLLDFIWRVKNEIPGVPVGYVDAYFEFVDHPRISDACDVLLANCYPFWEGCPLEYSLLYIKDMYHRAQWAAKGKKVIISETGWPSQGSPERGAVPGVENAIKYFINTYKWAEEEGVEVFYFSTFDEIWKIGHEGDVGAYWGLWDKDGILKFQ